MFFFQKNDDAYHQSPAYLNLEHQGGSDIILSYARIVVEQGGNRISYDPAGNASSRLTAGDRVQVNTSAPGIFINGISADYSNSGTPFSNVTSSDVTVSLIDIPSGNQVAAFRAKTWEVFWYEPELQEKRRCWFAYH